MSNELQISMNVDKKAFFSTGPIALNKLSPYLSDLPDTAKARMLVAREDLSQIDGLDLGTYHGTLSRIREIKDYHGLSSMDISDRSEHLSFEQGDLSELSYFQKKSYQQNLTDQLRAAWEEAQKTKRIITTNLFLPTTEMLNGKEGGGATKIVNETNLYSLRNEIGGFTTFRLPQFLKRHFNGHREKHLYLSATSASEDFGFLKDTPPDSSHVACLMLTDFINFADFSAKEKNYLSWPQAGVPMFLGKDPDNEFSKNFKGQNILASARIVALSMEPT